MMSLARRVFLGTVVATMLGTAPVLAAGEEQALVDRARTTLDSMKADPNMADFRNLLSRARGVLVVPQLVRAGFFFGAEGGEGVLLGRDARGQWSYPAFYTVAAGSFGLQIGAEMSEVVLLVMTDGGMQRLMEDKVTLGGDLSVAVGPVGAGVEARTTTNVGADIYAFARSKGIFGGLTVKGGGVIPANDANAAYYGRPLTPRQIVIEHRSGNPGAETLRRSLAGL
jgi:SH3 domain-containing YSC84-like protein 1